MNVLHWRNWLRFRRGGGSYPVPPPPPPPPPDPERLVIVGTSLFSTTTGLQVDLRGLNWGRWGFVQPGDGELVKSWGVNCLRIPLRWDGLYAQAGTDSRDDGSPGNINPINLAIHDDMMDQAEAAGLWIIFFIDSNCGQNGLQSPEDIAYCDPGGIYPDGRNFWHDASSRAKFIEAWEFLADRNKNRERIALIELMPEPNPEDVPDSDVRDFYSEVAAAVRPIGVGAPFMVGASGQGPGGAGGYSINRCDTAYNAAETDFVYTGNLFTFTGGTQAENIAKLTSRLQKLLTMREVRNVCIFVQQWGSNSSEDTDRAYQGHSGNLFINNNVGSTYWEMEDGNQANAYGIIYHVANGPRITKTARLDDLKVYWAGGIVNPPPPPPPPPPDTLLETGRIGGQIAQLIDFTADAITCDLMKRARNFAKPLGSPYQYTEATCLLRVASVTRASNVTTVVLSEAPASYQGDANIRTGFRLVLTCPGDPTFNCNQAVITVTDQTHFTYPNTDSNGSYTAVNQYDIAATTIHSVAVGATGHPIEDFNSIVCTLAGSATANSDLDGTYTGYFDGGIPTGMSVSGAALTNWTPGGADNQFTVTINGTDTEFIEFAFTGVPPDGSFITPRVIRNDHDQSGDTFLRPDFAQFLSRFGFMRFMDGGRTNSNAFVRSWAKRPLVACGLGMTLEDMVAMCNQLGCNMWYCFPFWVTDDYITQAATFIKNNLDPTKWCIYERCNENWNDGTFPHLAWDLTLCRKEMKAFFHGSYGENEITSVSRAAGTVTVNLNRAPPFANGATAVFKITAGSSGYDTPDAGAVMTVSGNQFSFTGGSASGAASVTRATIIGDPADPLYSDHLYLYRELAFRMHGKKTYDMAQLINAVYGSLNDKARVVLMGWNTNFVPFGIQEDVVFPWLLSQYGALSNWLYGIGGAPYTNAGVGNTTAAQVKTAMLAELTTFEPYFDRVTALCATYGLHHVQYEGGPDLTNLGSNHTLINALYSATEYREVQAEIIDRTLTHGVELHCPFYTSMAFPGINGDRTWGIARTLAADGGAIGSATTSRVRGLDDALLAAPP